MAPMHFPARMRRLQLIQPTQGRDHPLPLRTGVVAIGLDEL